ncbi:hypothetical protein AX774_g5925 [Zancudomyces culisetae]|uniref:Uncharacterized protein n=1 Tax=Zancudomyces culisetae TaxID=1213189 RepID=A0A1R1PIA9_ZANCU|nr:hypothetical protein AX774_g5925 [Zancudomyces culisetae]|eukprot:OMH80643.1 hypothetical protein AX774_g5925 [Zancudomyces culisetae]
MGIGLYCKSPSVYISILATAEVGVGGITDGNTLLNPSKILLKILLHTNAHITTLTAPLGAPGYARAHPTGYITHHIFGM